MCLPTISSEGALCKNKIRVSRCNGTIINTYGPIQLHLNLGLRRTFSWKFVIADVAKPIIGVDLLSFYNLLVDCRSQRLIDGTTTLSVVEAEDTRKHRFNQMCFWRDGIS